MMAISVSNLSSSSGDIFNSRAQLPLLGHLLIRIYLYLETSRRQRDRV